MARRVGDGLSSRQAATDLALSAYLSHSDLLSVVSQPRVFVEFVRGCLDPVRYQSSWVKRGDTDRSEDRRFLTLVATLEQGVPSLSLPDACRIGQAADRLASDTTPYETFGWAADIGYHVTWSSLTARKGRLLSTLARYSQAESCLELGTGYGLSALFIAAGLPREAKGHLHTIENAEPQFSLAADLLLQHEPDRVTCHHGLTTEVLPTLRLPDRVGLVFHDANHTGPAYLADFAALEPLLRPGGLLVIDDIRWESPLPGAAPTHAYEGWTKILDHPRVVHAVELDGEIGLLQLR